jgi:hypothetical protein
VKPDGGYHEFTSSWPTGSEDVDPQRYTTGMRTTTCYVRVTNASLFNNTDAKEAAFTIAG